MSLDCPLYTGFTCKLNMIWVVIILNASHTVSGAYDTYLRILYYRILYANNVCLNVDSAWKFMLEFND